MSDSHFRNLVRSAVASGSEIDMNVAINYGHRIGLDVWGLLNNGIPLESIADEIAAIRPPLREDTFRVSDLVSLGIQLDPDIAVTSGAWDQYIPSRSGKYPLREMCKDVEEYWKISKNYDLFQDGTLLQSDDFHQTTLAGGKYGVVTDPQMLSTFVNLSYQTDVIQEARKLAVKKVAGDNSLLLEILSWHMAYTDGILDEPQIISVDGFPVAFWSVGQNSSHSFKAGLYQTQRYQYSFGEGDSEPYIRMVNDWRGYYGHF